MFRRDEGLAKPGEKINPPAVQDIQDAGAPQTPGDIQRYIMRQRILALGQGFTVNNAAGEPVFKIEGKIRIIKAALKFHDMHGNLLYKLDEKVLRIRKSYDILKADGQVAAGVYKAIIDPLRERFKIEIPNGEDMTTLGKVIWSEYEIQRNQRLVAKISKQFSWIGLDQYVVDVLPGEDDCLILAITVVIDMMVSKGK